jgi:thiamine-monophosphate kinase
MAPGGPRDWPPAKRVPGRNFAASGAAGQPVMLPTMSPATRRTASVGRRGASAARQPPQTIGGRGPAGRSSRAGEREWVRWLQTAAQPRRDAGGRRAVRLGIGDDAAILRFAAGEDAVVTTDLFLEGVHFLRARERAADCGYRCASRALSDLAAMGARPAALFVSLALPPASGAWGRQFFRGLLAAARQAGAELAGGDLAASPRGVLADIVGLGAAPRGRALTRAGARPGDRLFVSGRLGLAAAGRAWVQGGARRGAKREMPPAAAIARFRRPRARWELGMALAAQRLATAAMDISDGLSLDLARLCAASGVGAVVDAARLPHLPGPQGLRHALAGGEDYELLFTVPARNTARLRRLHPAGVALTEIGEITAQPGLWLRPASGPPRPLAARGWDHFQRRG